MEDAKVVSLNMEKLYAFLIVGKRGAGHKNCMRTILEAAKKKNALIIYIDQAGRESFRLEEENIHYANIVQDIYNVSMDHLLPVIKERLAFRKDKERKGISESMIQEEMKAFQPVFVMIDDIRAFTDTVCHFEGSERIREFWEQMIDKARGLGLYIFAGTTENRPTVFITDNIARMLLDEKQGICVGGAVDDQNLLECNLVRYKERMQPMNPSEGRLCLPDNNDLIKIPR